MSGQDLAISVIIPVYNRSRHLEEAVASAQEALRGIDYEIVVVNDHSDEPDCLAALRTLSTLPRVSVVDNVKGRRGPSVARNLGASCSRGRWIAFLDSDDRIIAGAFVFLWSLIGAYPQVRWFAGHYLVWNDRDGSLADGDARRMAPFAEAFAKGEAVHFADARPLVSGPTSLAIGATLIRRDLWDQTGGFDEDIWIGEDWLLWAKFAATDGLVFSPEPVLHYRRSHESLMLSDRALSPQAVRAFRRAFFKPPFPQLRNRARDLILAEYRWISDRHSRQGRTWKGIAYALKAVGWGPDDARSWRQLGCAAAAHFQRGRSLK